MPCTIVLLTMRTATAAVATTALLLGSASADGWGSWSDSTDDSSTPVLDTSKPSDPSVSTTWSEWDPATSTTTAPADSSVWSEWDPATPSSSTSNDPQTWSEWESTTSSKPVTKTSSTSDPHVWSQWTSSSASVSSKTTDPGHTWSAWDPTETVTKTSTSWATVTVFPVNGGQSWSAWDPSSKTTVTSTTVVSSTSTKTATGVKDTTSASSQNWTPWSAPAAPVAVVDPLCKLEVSISYGLPIWYPTPVIATSVNSTAWGDWEQASTTTSTPAVKTSTTTDPGQNWSQWVPATSSTPAVKTSTDPAAWGTWGAISQTQGGAFYTASASASASAGNSGSNGGSNSGSWSKGSTGISANGNKFGMTYSPYTAAGGCKDQGTVSADIAKLAGKGFTSVRVYSTDCSTLEFVGSAARQYGVKIILGVFISDTGISGAQPQVDAIAKWAQWDLVELIVVGNEAVFNNRCSASDLAGFIGSAKKSFQGAGFTGAVSTTDELSVWQSQGSAWCGVVDVVSANLYAFFNANTAAEDAGDFIQRQIQDLSAVCPGKEVYVMESGWPSAGECNGKACPSPENQATAIKGIQQTSGAKVVFFSFEDEQWKQPGQYGVEQHWGCGSVFN